MRRLVLAGASAAALLLTACGADRPDGATALGERVVQQPPTADAGGDASVDLASVSCPPIEGYDGPVADEGIGAAVDGAVDIDAGDFFFGPTCVVNPADGTVTMTVTNSGGILHNVSVDDQSIDVDVAPGETIVVDVAVGSEVVVFVCKFHRTAGMVGAVVPAA